MVDHLRSRSPGWIHATCHHRKGAAGRTVQRASAMLMHKRNQSSRTPIASEGRSGQTGCCSDQRHEQHHATSKCNTIKLPTFGRIRQPHRALASGAQFMGATGSPRYRRLLIRSEQSPRCHEESRAWRCREINHPVVYLNSGSILSPSFVPPGSITLLSSNLSDS
jgi:hypothetical protein